MQFHRILRCMTMSKVHSQSRLFEQPNLQMNAIALLYYICTYKYLYCFSSSSALDCGPDMVYQLSAPACLPTCSKPNAPEECGLPKTESCVCADNNAVVVDGKCVSAQTCGCTDDNGVHHEVRWPASGALCLTHVAVLYKLLSSALP